MRRFYLVLPIISALVSCGSSKDSDPETTATTPSTSTAPKTTCGGKCVQLPLFGKSLNIEDALFRADCSTGYFSYLAIKNGNDVKCSGAKIASTFDSGFTTETWTAKFSDDSSAFTGTIKTNEEKITINGTTYFCYITASSTYPFNKAGTEKLYSTSTIITKTAATKPSEVKDGDVFALGTMSSADICNAIY